MSSTVEAAGVSADGRRALSQTDLVVAEIRRMIVSGDLAPGVQLPVEKDLAAQLGVSRGSLREGIRALSILGVLETRQGAGTFVTALDASLLLAPMGFVVDLQQAPGASHVHSVRRVLEAEAVALAARFMTEEQIEEAAAVLDESEVAIARRDHEAVLDSDMRFHRLIAHSCGNPVLAALIDALSSRTVRDRMWRGIADEHADAATLGEHRAVLRAIRDRDPGAASVRMANHLLSVEEFIHAAPSPLDD